MTVGELKAALATAPDDMPVVVEVILGVEMCAGAKVDDAGVRPPSKPTVIVDDKEIQATTNFVIVGNACDPDRVFSLRRPS